MKKKNMFGCSINIVKDNTITSYDLISKKKRLFKKYVNGKYEGIVEGKDLRGVVSQCSFYASLIYNN